MTHDMPLTLRAQQHQQQQQQQQQQLQQEKQEEAVFCIEGSGRPELNGHWKEKHAPQAGKPKYVLSTPDPRRHYYS